MIEDIQSLQERTGLISFGPYELGEHVANQRLEKLPESSIPWTSQVTNPIPASGDPNNLDIVNTQHAEMVLGTEKYSLFPPPNTRL